MPSRRAPRPPRSSHRQESHEALNPYVNTIDGNREGYVGDAPRPLVPLQYSPQPQPEPTIAQRGRSLLNPFNAFRSRPVPAPLRLDPLPSPRLRFESPRTPPRLPHEALYTRQRNVSSEASQDGGETPSNLNPFEDSRPPSRTGSVEVINTQTVTARYDVQPTNDMLMFPEDVESDDYLHNPSPVERRRNCIDWKVICSRRGVVNMGGLMTLLSIVALLFVLYPMSVILKNGITGDNTPTCTGPLCLNDHADVPLLQNIRDSLIDPDTPESAKTIKSASGKDWELVFSDEFNTDGRTFFEGDDPFFQAVDIWYGVTQDLEWYDPDAITTKDGVLEIRFDAFQNHALNYRSGMLQSWNKMCFKGGRVEASISLPGRGDTSGFWPGFWTMGNLGRPGYAASTDGVWPYSYEDVCDAGITANQSSTDGISYLPGMRLPACTCSNEDHPTPGKSRSAPEIDVLEASVITLDAAKGLMVGDVSQSAQVAPFDIWYLPDYNFAELYDPHVTTINPYRGGPYQQAVSALTNLNNNWYDGKEYQVYAFEYIPGAEGEVTWFVGNEKTWKVDGRALGPNGNVGQRLIPVEPMSLVMNFGMSSSFSAVNFTGLAPLLPATMRFDYVRIYQDPDERSVTCDPEGWETTEYIKSHEEAYKNPNLTTWADTKFNWPRNELVHGC